MQQNTEEQTIVNLGQISGGRNEGELYLTDSNLLEQSRKDVSLAIVGLECQGIFR